MQTTLTRIFIVIESESHGLPKIEREFLGNELKFTKLKRFFRPKSGGLQKKKKKRKKRSLPKLRLIFWPKSEIQTFFPPKFRWSPKKKRSSPKLRLIFRLKSEIHTLFQAASRHVLHNFGTHFLMGELFSIFHQKSASKAPKTCDFAYFTSQWRRLELPRPPPPPLATLLLVTVLDNSLGPLLYFASLFCLVRVVFLLST